MKWSCRDWQRRITVLGERVQESEFYLSAMESFMDSFKHESDMIKFASKKKITMPE